MPELNESPDEAFQKYLKKRFGTKSENYQSIVPILFQRLDDAGSESDITTSYRLWQESIDVNISKIESAVENTISELDIGTQNGSQAEEFLYCLQSYYALVLQLDRIVNMHQLIEGRDIDHIQYNDLCANYENLLDQPEDRLFYGWLTNIDFNSEPFHGLVSSLLGSPRRKMGEDVFKDLYQDIIGNPFRKAMGEFYTREWVADLIIDEIEYDNTSVLDPACGSGAFLVKTARRVIQDSGKPEDIERIHGFDLNPVAVMAAKSNLLGVLSGYLKDGGVTKSELADVNIPVYWTNSIIWTEPDLSGNNITLLSPYGELNFPSDPDEATKKISNDIGDWIEGKSFNRITDDNWVDSIAESFAAPVVCPPVDYVVGNPPWVSPDRMPKDYRDRVKELLEESGVLKPFQPDYLRNRFPNRQFVAALPFFEVTMDRYLKDEGICAYLVTSSLLKSMNGGGFREQMQEWSITRILDFTPYTDIHQNASSWAFVPVITKSPDNGDNTLFEFFVPTDGEMASHPGSCRTIDVPDMTLHVCAWEINLDDLPFIPDDSRSPWFTAPPEVIESYRKIIEGNPHVGENYRFTRGVVTGRNGVYLLDDVEQKNGFVEAQSKASEGKVTLESDLVYPFIEGKHLTSWDFDHTHLMLPYEVPEWEPIAENVMQDRYPKATSYIWDNKEGLEGRRTHTIMSQMNNGSPFYVVETRDILGEKPVVGIREMAPYLEAAVIPETIDDEVLGKRESIIAHTLNFVVPDSENEAYYLAAMINSWPLRVMMYDLAQPKGGRPGKRYDMYLISSLPIPEFDPSDEVHEKIADLGREAHGTLQRGEDVTEVESDLNEVVCEELYGITIEECDNLRKHYDRLAYTPN